MTGAAHEASRAAPPFVLQPPTAAVFNHLLRGAAWARQRLQPFAGKAARFQIVPFAITLTILDSGEVIDTPEAAPDASFTLAPGIALRVLAADPLAWQSVGVGGDTALTREILYVAQNLRWDIEEDLSHIFGDIAAHRMVRAAEAVTGWQRDSAASLTRAAAAYWTEERPLLTARRDVERFVQEVDNLRDDVARIEKRIEQFITSNPGH